MKFRHVILAALALAVAVPIHAEAGTPAACGSAGGAGGSGYLGIMQGAIWPPSQWIDCYAALQPLLGFTPLNPANNLSDLANAQTAVENLGLADIQSIGAGLTLGGGSLSANVTSVMGRTGAVTLQSSDIAAALGYAPVNPASLGSAASKNTGTTVTDPGTGTLEFTLPVQAAITGASKTFAASDTGKFWGRSNSGSAMTDTLPSGGGTAKLLALVDLDASASDTLTVTGGGNICTASGCASSYVLGAQRRTTFIPDSSGNWDVWTNDNNVLLILRNLADVANAATARGNIGAAASGANNDISSLGALTTPVTVGQGGTNAGTPAGARTNLGAASITALGQGYFSGPYYLSDNIGSLGTQTLVANTIYATLRYVGAAQTWTKISINVLTGAAGASCEIGIYNDSNGAPSSLLIDAGNVSAATSATTPEITSLSIVTSPGFYWDVVWCNGTPALQSLAVGNPRLGYTSFSSAYTGYAESMTYTGVLPATFSGALSTNRSPVVGLRF